MSAVFQPSVRAHSRRRDSSSTGRPRARAWRAQARKRSASGGRGGDFEHLPVLLGAGLQLIIDPGPLQVSPVVEQALRLGPLGQGGHPGDFERLAAEQMLERPRRADGHAPARRLPRPMVGAERRDLDAGERVPHLRVPPLEHPQRGCLDERAPDRDDGRLIAEEPPEIVWRKHRPAQREVRPAGQESQQAEQCGPCPRPREGGCRQTEARPQQRPGPQRRQVPRQYPGAEEQGDQDQRPLHGRIKTRP